MDTRARKIISSYLRIRGRSAPCVQLRRGSFSGSRVRKCIHIMHRISISPWHRNGRIVPAFVTYHFMHCILHKSFHHHASASNMFSAYHLFSCLLMHDPCLFLCKTKIKKGSTKIHTAFLVTCVRYHEPTMLGS